MQKVVLPNGITVVYQHKPGNSAVVEVLVKVGSNHESPSERGISHFLEHILFEGTKTRPTNRDISNEIERIGGDFNAYTTSERTCFYVQVLRKHFPKAVEILADIFENSFFAEKSIEKEKKIVLKEIDMINDEPRFYQWLLFQKNLFIHHPCRYPTYGDSKVIRGLTRQKILDYFHKHYIPQNIVVSIVGDLPRWKREIQNKFNLAAHRPQSLSFTPERGVSKSITVREKRKIANTYTVLGFRTVPRTQIHMFLMSSMPLWAADRAGNSSRKSAASLDWHMMLEHSMWQKSVLVTLRPMLLSIERKLLFSKNAFLRSSRISPKPVSKTCKKLKIISKEVISLSSKTLKKLLISYYFGKTCATLKIKICT